ncbi:MAG: hypothetical protein KBS35_01875 [Mycoplasma sp.]|nr:hypothetical protein [Candidatus Hennigella equi]
MKLTVTPAGRSLKYFASIAGSYSGAVLFLTLLEYLGLVRHPEDAILTIFSVWYVGTMFVICVGLLIAMTVCSIFTYVKVCKEKQKKFLLFALPAHVISAVLMFVSILVILKDKDSRNVGCIMNLIAGLVALYLAIISGIFKHIAYGKARKANKQN